jgi:predicted RNA-binding Zn ribbon-like protein
VSLEAVTGAPLLGEPLPVELMNTIWADRGGVHDALATRADVLSWMQAISRLQARNDVDLGHRLQQIAPRELNELVPALRALRDALRRLAAEQTVDPRERATSAIEHLEQAVDVVNRAASAAPHWSRLEWSVGGPGRFPCTTARGADAIQAAIAEQAIDLFTGDLRHELRACLAPRCVLYFVRQHSRREWCSTACGNRARMARHYQRHAGTRSSRGS